MKNHLEQSDEELLKEYQETRNPLLLNILFTRHVDVGYRTAMHYMHNQSDAEDVLQLAFIQFLQNLHLTHSEGTKVKAWLMKVIVNISLNKLRDEKRRAHHLQKVASERFQQKQQQMESAQMTTDTEDLKNKIRNFVDSLPEKYRSPIWLILYEGFTYPEVATVLDLPEKTIRTQVSRGLERLREILKNFGSVLSVDAISGLMTNSTLELAPDTVKKIIDSPELYNSVTPKFFKPANISDRIFDKIKIFSLIKIFSVIVVVLIAWGSYLAFKNYNSDNLSLAKISESSQVKSTDINYKGTNQTWVFINEKDRELPLLMGKWAFSSESKGMTDLNTTLMIELPINPQNKPFVIESTIAPAFFSSEYNLYFKLFWVKDKSIIKHESFGISKYELSGKEQIHKTYVYQNYICIFMNNKCLTINKYSEDLANSNISIVSKNFVFKKIESKTFDNPPEELLRAIEKTVNLSGKMIEKWQIDESKFIYGKEAK